MLVWHSYVTMFRRVLPFVSIAALSAPRSSGLCFRDDIVGRMSCVGGRLSYFLFALPSSVIHVYHAVFLLSSFVFRMSVLCILISYFVFNM